MKHSINCLNEVHTELTIEQLGENQIKISIFNLDKETVEKVIINNDGLFDLIGSLHHFQKKMKK